jgi:ribosomal protein S18 acetylase RimI-like enzyme
MSFSIEPVAPADWPMALRILFARFPEEEQPARQAAALTAAAAGKLNLHGLRWALQNDVPVGATLVMEQPDRVSLVWPPIVTCAADDPEAVERALLAEVAGELDESDCRLSQILFDPDEIADLSPYRAVGFVRETNLFFVARSLHEELPAPMASDLRPETFDAARNADRFAAVVEATYRESLDCRILDGLRTGQEALASHRLSGEFDPQLWRVFSVNGAPAAVLLLNDHPEQDSLELVYFGVTPPFRGRGYGRALVCLALESAVARGRTVLFAAVDAQNSYANAIYSSLGFVELARRKALFRFPRQLARE